MIRVAVSLAWAAGFIFGTGACAQDFSPLFPDAQLRVGIEPGRLVEASVPDIQWRRDVSRYIRALEFSADGRQLVALRSQVLSDTVVTLIDVRTAQITHEQIVDSPNGVVAISSTGRLAAAAFNYLDLYDLHGGGRTDRLPCPRCVGGVVTFSADGSKLAHQDASSPAERKEGGVARVIDLSTKRVVEVQAVTGAIRQVAFSPDGSRFLATHITYVDGKERLGYRVWDTADWTLLRTVSFPGWTLGAIDTGSVGAAKFVAVHGNGENIEMRDLGNDTVLWSVPMIPPQFASWRSGVKEVELNRVAIAPNGSFVMSYERPRPTHVEDMMDREHGGLVVRRSADGSIVAVYDLPYLMRFAIAPDSKTFAYATAPNRPLAHLALVHVPPYSPRTAD